jgi:hypothetical protein
MRFLLAVQLAGIDPLAPAIRVESGRQPLFHEALPHPLHGGHPDADRLGNPHVRPRRSTLRLVGPEQHLRMLQPAHLGLAARQKGCKLITLRPAQRHPIPLHRPPPSLPGGQNAQTLKSVVTRY